MLIGEDFEKIVWQPFGFDFVEPNAMIGDTLIFILSLYFVYRIHTFKLDHPFFKNWGLFFVVFGISFFLGGLGHLCFNYWGVPGKYPSWYLGIFAPYFVEQAMISLMTNHRWKNPLVLASKIKLFVALICTTFVYIFVDLQEDPSIGLRPVTINITIGLLFSLGYLGYTYSKTIHRSFRYFWLSVLLLLPAPFLQSMKINFFQWFDRNDASHMLLIFSLISYYLGIRSYANLTSNR